MNLDFIQVVEWTHSFFFLLLSSMYDGLLIHSPIEKHFSGFQILIIMS